MSAIPVNSMISGQGVISFLEYAANINIIWIFIIPGKIQTKIGHPHASGAIIMRDNSHPYVHGHSDRESERLHYQASKLADLLHNSTRYPLKSRVLEVGCGVGAQTVILAQNSPGAEFMSVDISPESLALA